MRHGTIVHMSNEIPGAYTVNGRAVGIYQQAFVDAVGQYAPDRVVILKPDGTNLMRINAEDQAERVEIALADAIDLRAADSAEYLPEPRRHEWIAPGA